MATRTDRVVSDLGRSDAIVSTGKQQSQPAQTQLHEFLVATVTVRDRSIVRGIENLGFDVAVGQGMHQRRVFLTFHQLQIGQEALVVAGGVDGVVGVVSTDGIEVGGGVRSQGHDVLDIQLCLSTGVGLIVGQVDVVVLGGGDGVVGQAREGEKLFQILVGIKLAVKLSDRLVGTMVHLHTGWHLIQIGQKRGGGDVGQGEQRGGTQLGHGTRGERFRHVRLQLNVLRQRRKLYVIKSKENVKERSIDC